jgi:hypothetical protein
MDLASDVVEHMSKSAPLLEGHKQTLPRDLLEFHQTHTEVTHKEQVEMLLIGGIPPLRQIVRFSRFSVKWCYASLSCLNDPAMIQRKIRECLLPRKDTWTPGNIFGLQCEPRALQLYNRQTGLDVTKAKLMVNAAAPFFTCSPDGLVVNSTGKVERLVEIKSPQAGKYVKMERMLEACPAVLVKIRGEWTIRHGSSVFFQVQLGMGIANAPAADVVFYNLYQDKVKIIKVKRNDKYIRCIVAKFTKVYYDLFLPALYATTRVKLQKMYK